MSAPVRVTDAMVHAFDDAYSKNWEAQRCAPEGANEQGTFFATRAGLEAALSAQPSPGGQGALVTDAMVEAAHAAYWAHPDDSGEDRPCMRAALEAALAARQPVGEPVERLVEAIEGECDGLVISTETASSILAHVFPTGQVATAYMVDGRIEQGLFFDLAAAETMAAMNAGEVVPLFRSPAQAVGTVLGGEFHYITPKHGLPDGTKLYAKLGGN